MPPLFGYRSNLTRYLEKMFDTVKCEYPLPLPENLGECSEIQWAEFEFKTGNFDGRLDEYEITEDGEIYHWNIDREWREDEDHPMGGNLEEVHRELKKIDWTGELSIHGVNLTEDHDYLFEFKIILYKGQVKEVERVTWKEEGSEERKKVQKQFEDLFLKEKAAKETWLHSLYMFWAFIIKFLCGCARWISGLVNRVTWKIERWLT